MSPHNPALLYTSAVVLNENANLPIISNDMQDVESRSDKRS